MRWLKAAFGLLSEGRHRQPHGVWKQIAASLAVLTAVFEVASLMVIKVNPYIQAVIFLSLMLPVVFILHSARKTSKDQPSIPDIILMVLSVAAGIYIFSKSEYFLTRWPMATQLSVQDLFFGVVLVIVSFEACRRTFGKGLTTVVSIAVIYALLGHLLPGAFSHSNMAWYRYIDQIAYTMNGIMGTPLQVAATYIFVFVTFGIFLDASGGGEFFFKLANAAAGRFVGGQAKVTTIACGLYGMISGSPTSDTVTVGSFAIPNMKRVGYDSVYAGAVTAVAATGGAIIPPVMGAAAFLMSEITGIPYLEICVAAIVPAVFYYLGILLQVHFHTLKTKPQIIVPVETKSFLEVLKESYYLLPLLILIVMLVKGYTPVYAGIIAILSTVLVSWTKKETRMGPRKLLDTIINSGYGVAPLVAVTAAAGIVVGSIMVTGLASKFMVLIGFLSGGFIPAALLVGAVVLIILGMGMPLSPVYILGAVLVAPVFVNLGFPLLLSHMFVVYYASLSAITPPVAVAAYAAGGIAKADPWDIGWQACRLGIVAYIVPFSFMFQPALLLQGNIQEIIMALVTVTAGIIALSAGIEGWFRREMSKWERALAILGGLLMMHPAWLTTGLGMGLILIGFLKQFVKLNTPNMKFGG
ncbi:TRAP transporter permease [Desulfosporosinus burensis]